jgi:hypothetical protein
MKKKMYVLGVAALVAALLALSGVAQSAMWVGAELGGNFNLGTDMKASALGGSVDRSTFIRPSVIGGATIGYDFVNSGFGAYAYPEWMKYFSFALDYTYNRLDIKAGSGIAQLLANNSNVTGYEHALTFLFMAHFGFMPDSEVPTGRINPYIGIGPAIVWTGLDFKGVTNRSFGGGHGGSAMNVALVVEPGIRWMCMKNVSVDTAVRYRYSQPSWDEGGVTIKANPLNQLAFLLRANYHF